MAGRDTTRLTASSSDQRDIVSKEAAEFWGVRQKPSFKAQKEQQASNLNAKELARRLVIKTDRSAEVPAHVNVISELPPDEHAFQAPIASQPPPSVQQQHLPDSDRHVLDSIKAQQAEIRRELTHFRTRQQELDASQTQVLEQVQAQGKSTQETIHWLAEQNKEIIARLANISRRQELSVQLSGASAARASQLPAADVEKFSSLEVKLRAPHSEHHGQQTFEAATSNTDTTENNAD